MNRCTCLPPLDDWKDGHPDAWDYDAVLKENGVTVEWCDEVDGNGNEHRVGEFAGWAFHWKHGAIHIGQTTETIARKAAALFVSLWLRGVSASFCDKIMSGMIWFWELQDRPSRVNVPNQLDLAKLFHETYERLAPDFGYTARPETRDFRPNTPNGWLMIAVCGEVIKRVSTVTRRPPLLVFVACQLVNTAAASLGPPSLPAWPLRLKAAACWPTWQGSTRRAELEEPY